MSIKNTFSWSWGNAWLIRCLLYKRKNLTWIPSTHKESKYGGVNPSLLRLAGDTDDHHSARLANRRASDSERPWLKIQGGKATEEVTWCCPLDSACTRVHLSPLLHAHICTFTQVFWPLHAPVCTLTPHVHTENSYTYTVFKWAKLKYKL